MKSNLLKSSALSLLVAAGVAGGCGSSKQVWVSDPDETAGSSSAGKAGGVSFAGQSSGAGEPAAEGGSAGVEEEAGEGGTLSGESGGTNGSAGSSGSAGFSGTSGSSGSGGSAGKAGGAGTGSGGVSGASGASGSAGKGGSGGTSGAAGSGGSAGKAGSGGATGSAGAGGTAGSGGSSAGSGGKAGTGGSSGSAGSGGTTILFTPASATCAAGNIDTLFTVCRNCHNGQFANQPPLLTYAQISGEKANITSKLTNNEMPPPTSGYTISATNKQAILSWISAGAVGVPYANGICP